MPADPQSGHTAEFNRLYDALPIAIKHACQVLQHSSSGSTEDAEADREVSRLLARIIELTNDEHSPSENEYQQPTGVGSGIVLRT